jgi:hypothetical protein
MISLVRHVKGTEPLQEKVNGVSTSAAKASLADADVNLESTAATSLLVAAE